MSDYDMKQLAYGTYLYPALWAQKIKSFGTNIFDKEWDILIILDACRTDAMRTVESEYDFISSVDSCWSVGSTSKEWIINTFDAEYKDEVSHTALVTGNGWSEKILENPPEWGRWTALNDSYWENHPISKCIARKIVSDSDFQTFVPVWGEDFSKSGNRAPRAEAVTDAAITVSRSEDPSKMIIHYMQPHEPYFCEFGPSEDLPEVNREPLAKLRSGGNKEHIWNLYVDNLRYVLDSVGVLLQNVDANKVVITADHGELFGELGLYGHVAGLPHPSLRKVPWIITKATDKGEYEPDYDIENLSATYKDVEARLEELGYL